MQSRFYECYVQFIMVNIAIDKISEICPLPSQTTAFMIEFREEFRRLLFQQVSYYPMWVHSKHYDLLDQFVEQLRTESDICKKHPQFVKALVKNRDALLLALNTHLEAEIMELRFLINQIAGVNDNSARSKHLRYFLNLTVPSPTKPQPADQQPPADEDTIDIGGNEDQRSADEDNDEGDKDEKAGEGDQVANDNDIDDDDDGDDNDDDDAPMDSQALQTLATAATSPPPR